MGFTTEGVIAGDNAIVNHQLVTYNFYDNYEATDPNNTLFQTYNYQLQLHLDLQTTGTAEVPVRSFRTHADGTAIVYGKKLNGLAKAWKGFKDKVRSILKWSDDLKGDDVHELGPKEYDKNKGGIMFTGTDGHSEETKIYGNGDRLSVNVDKMMFMFGHGGSGGLGNFSENFERFSNIMNAAGLGFDAYESFNSMTPNEAVKAIKTGSLPDKIERFKVESTINGHGIIIDTMGKDTNGYHEAYRRLSDSLFGF